MRMDINKARELSYEKIREMYKIYLQSKELGKNTVGTITGNTFYLWNNGSKDLFWNTVTCDDFEINAKIELRKLMQEKYNGDIDAHFNAYMSHLRRFRDWVYSAEFVIEEKDDATAIKEFLLDIECLEPLNEWTNSFNLFDILKITRTEIRHSNMLSWLLNPNENHGLGDGIIKGFIQYVVSSYYDVDDPSIFDILLMDCHDFIIQREWHNIDLLAYSTSMKFVLCIENKIGTGEHDNQLNRYKSIVEEAYLNYKTMYIFLSPEGIESSDPDNWYAMSYEEVLDIVEVERNRRKLNSDVALLIDNYIQTLRRDIVGDENLVKICAEIYAKHQKALDLIFENKPDKASGVAAIFMEWAKEKTKTGEIEVVIDKCVKGYIRFKTSYMSELLPDAAEPLSGWKTANYYFYEIRNLAGDEFFMQLALSGKDIPDDLRETCDRINDLYPTKQQKENWQWRTPYITKHSKVDEEMPKERIFEQLDKKLEDIKKFEEKLKSQLEEI